MTPLKNEARGVTAIRGTTSQDRALEPTPWWQRHRRLLVGATIGLVALLGLAIPALRALSSGERSVPLAQVRVAGVERGRFVSDVTAQGVVIAALSPTLVAPAAGSVHYEVRAGGEDTLFTMRVGDEPEIFHLSLRRFALNARTHHLYLLKQLTRELNAQEVLIWKRVIRVIAHELNNSLAPISSLAHSGRQLLASPDAAVLERVFATTEERAAHLKVFIDGYARFAKLPKPRPGHVEWPAFIERLGATSGFRLLGSAPATPGWFDLGQLEQALINLLKNAHESGSPASAIELDVASDQGGTEIRVLDQGSGMSGEVLEQALLPFYSTKANGTGLGLTLSREIVEAHGGRLLLAPRQGGGMSVSMWLPPAPRAVSATHLT